MTCSVKRDYTAGKGGVGMGDEQKQEEETSYWAGAGARELRDVVCHPPVAITNTK